MPGLRSWFIYDLGCVLRLSYVEANRVNFTVKGLVLGFALGWSTLKRSGGRWGFLCSWRSSDAWVKAMVYLGVRDES